MSILLAPDDVVVWHPNEEPDEHGWMQTLVPSLAWEGKGNVQESAVARSEPGADGGGGSGPYSPVSLGSAQAFLPLDAPIKPGMVVEAHARTWLVIAVRHVPDPTGGPLTCQVADLTERGGETWPAT